jgi:hypothetical protein
MDELSKTYTLARSPDGWRVNFSTGIAPGFGLEPYHSLFEVIGRVETLYPDTGLTSPLSSSRIISFRWLAADTLKNFKRPSRRQAT